MLIFGVLIRILVLSGLGVECVGTGAEVDFGYGIEVGVEGSEVALRWHTVVVRISCSP